MPNDRADAPAGNVPITDARSWTVQSRTSAPFSRPHRAICERLLGAELDTELNEQQEPAEIVRPLPLTPS